MKKISTYLLFVTQQIYSSWFFPHLKYIAQESYILFCLCIRHIYAYEIITEILFKITNILNERFKFVLKSKDMQDKYVRYYFVSSAK